MNGINVYQKNMIVVLAALLLKIEGSAIHRHAHSDLDVMVNPLSSRNLKRSESLMSILFKEWAL